MLWSIVFSSVESKRAEHGEFYETWNIEAVE
jgi:hypothetical protein